jgi:heterodisulfide reductase subunit A
MKQRIGIYICHCGGNISDYVDVEQIGKMFHEEDGVVVSKDVMFACADSNQKQMVADIEEQNLDAIVVASCSPKLHLHTFRNVAQRAGLNPSNYVQVNIREQCSWPHSDKPREATVKAAGLIRAGINRVAHSESLDNIELTVKRSVLIIGAGVSGMKAAIESARLGNDVYLIEKDFFVGGMVARNNQVFISNKKGKDIVAELYNEMRTYNNITLFTGATVDKVSGSLGNFHVDVKVKPRYINPKADKSVFKAAMEECAIKVKDEFNYGLSERKALYTNYPDALPDVPVVDIEALRGDNELLSRFASAFNLDEKEETLSLVAGAVLVSTGYDNYIPAEGEFGYQTNPDVITLPELKRLIELSPDKLIYNNKTINSVAFIYCVGNRQKKGENKYCSRQCCTSTIHTSLQLNEKYAGITAFHLYRDIRTYGKQEILFDKSSKQGDIYLRYDEKTPPVVERQGKTTIVKVIDHLTAKKELEIEADLVVLVTGMVSRVDSPEIASHFKIPIGNDKFFNEIHPKLKPVETVIKGVYIGGSCQGPKNISESVQSSLAASAKINALLKSGKVQVDPIIARVNVDACVWCGKCQEVCDYTAIYEIESKGKHVAAVNKGVCTGCGICAPVCPSNAIEIAQYTDNEIESMIDGFTSIFDLNDKEVDADSVETENGKARMKDMPQLWKSILASMGEEKKTVPEVAQAIGENSDIVTYHMMTMNKYSIIVPAGINEDDTYYYYKANH